MKGLVHGYMLSPTEFVWEAWVVFDPSSGDRIGIYNSREDAKDDCPGWKDEGFAIKPCEIRLVKKHRK